jgi:hypothetical protein
VTPLCNCTATLAALMAVGAAACKGSQPVAVAAHDAEAVVANAPITSDGGLHSELARSETIFDLFSSAFGVDLASSRPPDAYRLYCLSGPGGARPVMIQCRLRPDGTEVLVNKAVGSPGRPETWRPGRDLVHMLSTKEGQDLRRLAQTFSDEVHSGRYAENEPEWMDGAMVATEVSLGGTTARVVRSDRNDGSHLSAFEKKLFTVASEGFDGGIPGVRMRLAQPGK